MRLIDEQLLENVSAQAMRSERLRMNHNFHDALDAGAQRLLNALEPGTEIPIHRHRHTAETYILLRGRIRVLYYDGEGQMSECCILDPLAGNYGIHIPAGQWHSLEVMESGSVIFEVKDGPYTPLGNEDILGTP